MRLAPELNFVLQDALRLTPELNYVLQDALRLKILLRAIPLTAVYFQISLRMRTPTTEVVKVVKWSKFNNIIVIKRRN